MPWSIPDQTQSFTAPTDLLMITIELSKKMTAIRPELCILPVLVAAILAGSTAGAAAPVRCAVVIGPDAGSQEHHAAEQLCDYCDTLFGIETRPTTEVVEPVDVAFLLGNSTTNRSIAKALGEEEWPRLSKQGIVLKRVTLDGTPALVVGGGSPVATMWAVDELAERWGVRYLIDRDVMPARRAWAGLPKIDVIREPNMRIRCWRLVNDLADGPVSWSLEENRRFLRQMAKMKFNRIHVQLWPIQPFVHYTFRGMEKPPGVLYFGQRHPIDDDTIGREKFGGMKIFTNPELGFVLKPTSTTRERVMVPLYRYPFVSRFTAARGFRGF